MLHRIKVKRIQKKFGKYFLRVEKLVFFRAKNFDVSIKTLWSVRPLLVPTVFLCWVSICAQWLSWPKWSNWCTSCYFGGLPHLILCAMKILSDANMTNRFAYLSSGSVMVPMTVWMVQMKYFVKIKEGVKSKAKLYISQVL